MFPSRTLTSDNALMYNQRQKKRNAEFRKKHHEGRARDKQKEVAQKKGGGESQPSKVDHTQYAQEPLTRLQATPSNEKASVVQDKGTQHSQRKFSKRKVVSNWERYNEGDGGEGSVYPEESEEELQQRLVQLLNLPTNPHPLATPTDDIGARDMSTHEKHSFLSLDCAALAESVSSLPLHQRLDISLQLLKLGEDSSETETPPCGASSSNSVESSVVELSSCQLVRAKQPEAKDTSLLDFHFTSPSCRSNRPKQVTSSSNQGAKAKVTENTSFLRISGGCPKQQHSVRSATAKPSESDDILDQLLAEVPAQQPPADGSTRASQSGNVVGQQSNTLSMKPETGELDSMLDELLA